MNRFLPPPASRIRPSHCNWPIKQTDLENASLTGGGRGARSILECTKGKSRPQSSVLKEGAYYERQLLTKRAKLRSRGEWERHAFTGQRGSWAYCSLDRYLPLCIMHAVHVGALCYAQSAMFGWHGFCGIPM